MPNVDSALSDRLFRFVLLLLLSGILAGQVAALRRPQYHPPTRADFLALESDKNLNAADRAKRLKELIMGIPLTEIHGTVTVDVDSPVQVEFDGAQPVEFEEAQPVTLVR